MPVINGFKYSCEPCIRGHRATSCKHTDRILIEVRKPGRPLESCGHNLATCNCGKVASLFSVGEIFSAPLNEELGGQTNFIVTTPPQAPTAPAQKVRTPSQDRGRISKKQKKKSESPTMPDVLSMDPSTNFQATASVSDASSSQWSTQTPTSTEMPYGNLLSYQTSCAPSSTRGDERYPRYNGNQTSNTFSGTSSGNSSRYPQTHCPHYHDRVENVLYATETSAQTYDHEQDRQQFQF